MSTWTDDISYARAQGDTFNLADEDQLHELAKRLGPYYETFSGAIHGAIFASQVAQAVRTAPAEIWELCSEPLNYGCTRSRSFALLTLRGKPTRKYFHVTIYRLDSGRYELTTYVL
jgi:hypothetical protein